MTTASEVGICSMNVFNHSQVKNEGFDLTSKETGTISQQQNKQSSSMEGDAWAMNMTSAENLLLSEPFLSSNSNIKSFQLGTDGKR